VPVVVDPDRVRGGREAVRLEADILVLDDGFQHLQLARDLDLVLLDAGDPWGGDRLPPRGRLREPVTALGRASAVLVTKLPPEGDAVLAEICKRVARLAPGRPVLAARLRPTRVRTPQGLLPPSELAGRRVLAFAGVGRPRAFVEILQSLGAEIVAERWFPDHYRYTGGEIEGLGNMAGRLGAVLVTTAKDSVKLPSGAPAWVLEVEMIPDGGSWEPLWRLLPKGPL
jgi:tetraacyldisaccharide 4'-kinase